MGHGSSPHETHGHLVADEKIGIDPHGPHAGLFPAVLLAAVQDLEGALQELARNPRAPHRGLRLVGRQIRCHEGAGVERPVDGHGGHGLPHLAHHEVAAEGRPHAVTPGRVDHAKNPPADGGHAQEKRRRFGQHCDGTRLHHLFHADPHPGNILVTRNDQIAFLDYGMVGHLEPTDVYAMADLLRAVFEEDSQRCVEALLTFTVSGEIEDRAELEHDVAEYIAFEARSVLGRASVGKALEQVTNILRRHKLQLAPRFSMLLKAMATIESSAKVLDPTMDMAPILRPYVERIVMQRFSPQHLAKEGQRTLGTILRIGKEIPGDIQQLIRTARKGRLRVHLDHEGLDHLAGVTDRASNRIAFSVIAGSLIVGSSLLLSSDFGAKSLGFAGFTIAGVLGILLLISILRSRNY
ncbi:MAG: phosphotransferase [Bdellovibrionales bacterium]|nr:phosphotransferase [Bdellovibrionales bacterium]